MKTKLGIIFGGKSVEHEISIITGIIGNICPNVPPPQIIIFFCFLRVGRRFGRPTLEIYVK